ncbi:MAG: calcium/sodium antiporter [Bacteroidaceae bacterium]|nr:calcium/sodium antiporter [Bacteroidaceae bacterium]
MVLNIFFILIGFVLLVKGGDFLIDGAVAIAQRAKLSAMVIGLTVVGFGTSMPELLVSTQAAWVGSSGLAIGNVAGSNIANVALILGVTSLICPLPSQRAMMRIDIPFMVLAMVLFIAAAFMGTIERWMGICMVLLLIGFISWEVFQSRKQNKETEMTVVPMPLWKAISLVIVSLAAMVWGADLLIDGASAIAMELGELLGVGKEAMERIIGLTVVAVGTSLPELFASVMAARKGETDMAVGNIIGSVSFNILCVIGVASAITPIRNAWEPFAIDYAVMFGLAILLWLFLRTHHKIVRWEGAILLLIYILYIVKTFML